MTDETRPIPLPSTGSRRAFWSLFDQGLSSLTNAALSIVVARAVGIDEFGAFSLALLTFSFVIGLCRGLVSDPYTVRYSAANQFRRRSAASRASGAALVFGILAGLICAAAGLFFEDELRMAMFALALSLPGLMLQDAWRHVFFAEARPTYAALNDGVWAIAQFGLIAALLLAGNESVFWITLAWGASALLAALLGLAQTGVVPNPMKTWSWLVETRDLNVRMAADFALNMGAINLAIYVVTGIVGLAAAGALRAAQVLLGPLSLLFGGLSSFLLPAMVREAAAGRSLARYAVLTSGITGGIAGVWVLVLVLLPESLGKEVLGDSWEGAHSVMLGQGIVAWAVACVMGASLALKALRRADQLLRVTFLQAPLMLVLGGGGAVLWGAPGAAYGFAIAQVAGLLVSWVIFSRANREPRAWLNEEPARA